MLLFFEVANSVAEFDDVLNDSFARYIDLSNSIGGLVQEQSILVNNALNAQRQFIELASKSQKPDDSQFMLLLKPTSELITSIIVC